MSFKSALLTIGFLITLFSASFAQILEPVHWDFEVTQDEEGISMITATAAIDAHWHVYSSIADEDPTIIAPIPTSIDILPEGSATKVGAIIEDGDRLTEFDPNFDMDVNYYADEVSFSQKFKATEGASFVGLVLNYMTCDDSKCIFPEPLGIKAFYTDGKLSGYEGVLPSELTSENDTKTDHSLPNISDPIKWTFSSENTGDDNYVISMTATCEEHWHFFSQHLPSDEGPLPTVFNFTNKPSIEIIGNVEEGNPIKVYDPNFRLDIAFFEGTAIFKQQLRLISGDPDTISGSIDFQACIDEKCIFPPTLEFVVDLKTGKGWEKSLEGVESTTKFDFLRENVDLDNAVIQDCGFGQSTYKKETGIWNLFFLGFIGGLIALLTPCVFPMIPLTVSFFTKGSGDKKKGMRRALTYGFFIFLIYLVLSLPFHFLDQIDENILNNISTNVILNLVFFAVFLIFAFSFFGYYEITIPSRFANKMDTASDAGGLIGTFFMALTLAIVSFSCTGPILGSLLAGSLTSDGGAMQLTAGMGGFGLALGIPFALFAAFPGWLNSLPSSGGWLNSVKVVLGFAELALALKFLSNADLVSHWGILKIELFLGLWILIGIGTALYIFGKIKFPHDSPLKKLSFFRIAFGVLLVSWSIYLISGFRVNEETGTYQPLKLLSGLAPPVGYSWIYPNECPNNLSCEKDYMEALARAKRENKPIMTDFTGYACVNCRKMEEHVWSRKDIFDLLNEKFIVVSLYVDDNEKELPDDDPAKGIFTSTKTNKARDIQTYGDKWSALQIETYTNNSQPWYCLVGPDETLLNVPRGYTPDADEYKAWLECGLEAFEQLQNDKNNAASK